MAPSSAACFSAPDDSDLGLGLFLGIGTFLSYVPSFVAVLKRKSHIGLSFSMLLLASAGAYTNLLTWVFKRWDHFECCTFLSAWKCNEELLEFHQLWLNFLGGYIWYILAIVYYENNGTQSAYKEKTWIVILFIASVASGILDLYIGVVLIYVLGEDSTTVDVYTYINGIAAALIPIAVNLPQIWTTFKLKSPGSLSVITLLIQMPGSFLIAFFQVVLNDDLLVGLPQIVSGIQLLILLTMCLYYLFREWQQKRKSPKHILGPDPEGNVEVEPLLVNA